LFIIRATYLKSNISYNTLLFKAKKEEDKCSEIRDYINKFKIESFLTLRNKILIFYLTLTDIKLVANYFNCNYFYSKLQNNYQEVILNNFFNKFNLFN
jgi:hypothetical protein